MVIFSSGQTIEQLSKIQTIDVDSRFSGWLGVYIHGNLRGGRKIQTIDLLCYMTYLIFSQTTRTKFSASNYEEQTRRCVLGKSKFSELYQEIHSHMVANTVTLPYNIDNVNMKL